MNTIDQLAAALESAKVAENAATQARINAETALLQVCDSKDEGSTTTRGEAWRVVTTGVINRRFDAAQLEAIRPRIPA
ncbi:MAG: hypothetical protein ACOH2M_27180, partial [Cypionkella sp.]